MTRIPSGSSAMNRAARRLNGALKPGTAFVNTTVLYEVVSTLGAQRLIVRLKATAAGTLDVVPVGPDFDPAQTVAFASLAGTKYASNLPTQVVIVANTENFIKFTTEGENYVVVKFTGTASGAITFVDVSQVSA